ncbi:MAG: hypothetical protein GY789_00480 [Hyphomicrobiales bacterium]|nr:hypothetical protein [Hyphomicrobiales bacterium]
MTKPPEHFDYIPDVDILVKIITNLLERSPDAIAFMSYVDAKSKRSVGRYSEEEFERIRKSGLLGKWVRYLDTDETPSDVEFDQTYGNLVDIVYDTTRDMPERKLPQGGTIPGEYFAAITMFVAANICETIGKELKIN